LDKQNYIVREKVNNFLLHLLLLGRWNEERWKFLACNVNGNIDKYADTC